MIAQCFYLYFSCEVGILYMLKLELIFLEKKRL